MKASASCSLELRQVALKLIKVGMYDDSVLQQFQSERQSLAIMEHPWVAKVFDAGTTADGQPYFAMEYVPGVPITDCCDRKRMRIRERLELFIKVCEGVQHAHQKAIMQHCGVEFGLASLRIEGRNGIVAVIQSRPHNLARRDGRFEQGKLLDVQSVVWRSLGTRSGRIYWPRAG